MALYLYPVSSHPAFVEVLSSAVRLIMFYQGADSLTISFLFANCFRGCAHHFAHILGTRSAYGSNNGFDFLFQFFCRELLGQITADDFYLSQLFVGQILTSLP